VVLQNTTKTARIPLEEKKNTSATSELTICVKLQFSSRIEIRTTPKLFRSDTEAVKWTTLPVFDAIHQAFPKYVCLIKPLRARNIPPCGIEMIKPYTTNSEGRMSILAYLPSLILTEIEMILGWIRHDQSILNYDIYKKQRINQKNYQGSMYQFIQTL
jgi:hypothetical protein